MIDLLPQLIVNSLISGSFYALISIGFNLIFSVVRFFDMSYGALIVVGGYVSFFVLTNTSSVFLTIIFSIIVCLIVGLILNELFFKALKNNNASNTSKMLVSIGLMVAIQSTIAIIFNSQFKSIPAIGFFQKVYSLNGVYFTNTHLLVIIFCLIVTIAIYFVLRKSKFGKSLRAVSDDEDVSQIVGIRVNKIISKTYLVSSAVAGIVGSLSFFNFGIFPAMGMNLFLKGAVSSIIGGTGSIIAGVMGGFFLGFLENIVLWSFSGQWRDFFVFLFLILFLLIRRPIIKNSN